MPSNSNKRTKLATPVQCATKSVRYAAKAHRRIGTTATPRVFIASKPARSTTMSATRYETDSDSSDAGIADNGIYRTLKRRYATQAVPAASSVAAARQYFGADLSAAPRAHEKHLRVLGDLVECFSTPDYVVVRMEMPHAGEFKGHVSQFCQDNAALIADHPSHAHIFVELLTEAIDCECVYYVGRKAFCTPAEDTAPFEHPTGLMEHLLHALYQHGYVRSYQDVIHESSLGYNQKQIMISGLVEADNAYTINDLCNLAGYDGHIDYAHSEVTRGEAIPLGAPPPSPPQAAPGPC